MSLGDEQKPKQNTPSGSTGSNPQGGAISGGLTKADIEAAIKALDQEKQKLSAEIKQEQAKVASDNTADLLQQEKDSFASEQGKSQQEIPEITTEELEKSYDKEAEKNATSSQTAENQTESSAATINQPAEGNGQPKETQASEQSQKIEESQTGGETNHSGENRQEQDGQVSQSAAGDGAVEASPDYADYLPTGDPIVDAQNKAKVARMRQQRDEKNENSKKEKAERQQTRLQEKQDEDKEKVSDKLWDDYMSGKSETAPTQEDVNSQYAQNEVEKAEKKAQAESGENNATSPDNQQQESQGFDAKPPDDETSPKDNRTIQNPIENSVENPTNLTEGSNDYMPTSTPGTRGEAPKANDGSPDYMNYAPTGNAELDAANQASVDRMRQQRADDEKHALQKKEEDRIEKEKSKIDDQQSRDYVEGRRDTMPTKESVADQHKADQEKKQAQSQGSDGSNGKQDTKSNSSTESDAFKNKTDSISDKHDKSKEDKKSTDDAPKIGDKPKLGARLGEIGNKLNAAKNIAQDPAGAAKQAAEQKLKEYAQKAAQEAAKKAAQLAARAAQAAASAASSVISSVGAAVGSLSGFLIPFIIAVILFIAIFSAIAVDAYCTPREAVRGILEYSLTGDQKNLIQAGSALPIAGQLLAQFGNTVGKHSEIYKMFYNEGGICPDKSPDRCAQGSGSNVSAGGVVNGCFNQDIFKNPTIEFIKAQGLVKYTAQTAKIREIYDVGKQAGVPDEVIKWVIALSPTESDMSWDQYGREEDCYGIIQFCRSSGGSCTFQNALWNVKNSTGDSVTDLPSDEKNRIPGKPLACEADNTPGSSIIGDKVLQMKMAWVGFKLKVGLLNAPRCRVLWPGKSKIYKISASWLGCTTNTDRGGTSPVTYGEAAENNFNKITCVGTAKLETDNLVDQILNQLAQKTKDNNISLKTAIVNQIEDRLTNKNDGDNNMLSKFFGGVDVEAAGSPGNFVYSGEDATVLSLIASGKVTDVIPEVSQGRRPKLDIQIKQKELEPNTLKGLISIVNSGKFDSVRISSAYRAGDNPTSGHGSGQKFDIDAVTYQGKQYTHQNANDGDALSISAFYELAKTAKDTGILLHIISGGRIFEKISTDNYLSGTQIVRDDRVSPIYGAIHENHYDLRFNPGGVVANSAATGSLNDNGCVKPCGDSNGSSATNSLGSNSTTLSSNPPNNFIITDETGKVIKQINGGQAVSGASIFKVIIASVFLKNSPNLDELITLDNRVWLYDEKTYTENQQVSVGVLLKDMLNDSNNTAANALMRKLGGISGEFDAKAKSAGYNSVSFKRYFTAGDAKNLPDNKPGAVRNASVEDVNKALIDIFNGSGVGYSESQNALKTNPHTFNIPTVEGIKHGNTTKLLAISAKLNIDGKTYYSTSIYNTTVDWLKNPDGVYTFKSGNPIDKFYSNIKKEIATIPVPALDANPADNTEEANNILNGLVNGVDVSAQSASTVAEKRAKLKDLFKKGFIAQTINVQKDDALGYESGYDDNMIGLMYDLYYKVGITWIGGPKSWGRAGGDHGKGDAMDAWAFGYVSEIEGKNLPIKGYTGVVELYPGNSGTPGSQGNVADPRLFRMLDAGSENSIIKQKTIDIFKKVVDAAYSTGLVKQYGKGQSYGATGFPNVYGHDELAKIVGATKMFGHSNGSVLPIAGSPPSNGHLNHLHISIIDEQYAKYTGVNGVSASAPCGGECTQSTPAATGGVQGKVENELTNILNYISFDPLLSIDAYAAFGSKPTSYDAIKGDAKYLAFLKEIADTRGYEQYKDVGGKNSEMQAALSAMVSASGGKLNISNTYSSHQDQVGTYFASSSVTSPITKYWSPSLSASELAITKASYLARGTVSAPPGFSQHSTGLAVDFDPVEDNFKDTDGYTWLKANAGKYGFKESYPVGTNKGAGYEPWHWQFEGNAEYKLSTPLSSFQIGGTGGSSSNPCPPVVAPVTDNSEEVNLTFD
jgi:hypothetical protein